MSRERPPRSSNRPTIALVVLALLIALAFGDAEAGQKRRGKTTRAPRKPLKPVHLVWHVETLEGAEVSSVDPDIPINPASVVKVATTLWALEKLGPDHRFDTRFATRGRVAARSGVLEGDLLVQGTGDPDFHAENAFLVAARLNQLGIRRVRGILRVNDTFWIGWEGGSDRTIKNPETRARMMAQRLRVALDPTRWDRGTRAAWQQFAARYSLPASAPPRVEVSTGAAAGADLQGAQILLTHRSKPLVAALRRFDAYSNNDIERLGSTLGPPSELVTRLARTWELPEESLQLATLSGLGENRMSSRLIVRLLRELRETCGRLGLTVESVLPVAGCDPGTLSHSFLPLYHEPFATSVVAKTGTLTSTDGGTAVLAGFANTGRGELVFAIAAPNAGGQLHGARLRQLDWVQQLITRSDGPRPRGCGNPLGWPEGDAHVFTGPEPSSVSAGVAAGR